MKTWKKTIVESILTLGKKGSKVQNGTGWTGSWATGIEVGLQRRNPYKKGSHAPNGCKRSGTSSSENTFTANQH